MLHSSDLKGSISLENLVVKTKLRTPKARSEHVPRLWLLKLLKASSEHKLTLISAPAGYGKTTLLTQWCRSEEGNLPIAWVSLDQDNDVVRLWRHVIEAFLGCKPGKGFGADVLGGEPSPRVRRTGVLERRLQPTLPEQHEVSYQ